MNQTATPKVDVRVRPNVISVKSRKTTAYSDKIVTALGPKIWNKLHHNIETENYFSNLICT